VGRFVGEGLGPENGCCIHLSQPQFGFDEQKPGCGFLTLIQMAVSEQGNEVLDIGKQQKAVVLRHVTIQPSEPWLGVSHGAVNVR